MYTRTKHILPLFLLCIAVFALALCASAETKTGACGDNLTYTLDTSSGTLTITGTGEMWDFTFNAPWYYDCSSIRTVTIANGVTSIGYDAFFGCSFTSITIPDSVTSIESDAFRACSLTSITIPDSVTSIGDYHYYGPAFIDCSSLTGIHVDANNPNYTSVDGVLFNKSKTTLIQAPGALSGAYTIPDSVTSIGDEAFWYCSFTSITIPTSVTSIGWNAFRGCSSLVSITIPDSVASIGEQAFYGCSSLTSITIPDSVTSIGVQAFKDCSSLANITIPDSVTSIGAEAFDGTAWLDMQLDDIVYLGKVLLLCRNENLTQVTVQAGTKGIAGSAFFCAFSLTSITIPDSAMYIGDYAFSGCSSLTNITIPDSVTYIGDYAFSGCSSLTNITIPDSVTYIGDYAFSGCSSLTNITIPDSVTSIGWNAFEDTAWLNAQPDDIVYLGKVLLLCRNANLTQATVKTGTKAIAAGAFSSCSSLADITIPDSVTSIEMGAFFNCSSLVSITFPDSVTSIGEKAFSACSSLVSITIPDSVTSIGNFAFSGCDSLTNITIPDSVTSIGDSAFEDCSSLTSFTIPDSVTSIGDWAFSGCSSLTSITIPDSVTYIGAGAFNSTFVRCTAGSSAATCARGIGAQVVCINSAETADGRVVVKGLVDGAIADGAALTAATLDNSVVPANVLKKLGREPVFSVLDIALESDGTAVRPNGRFTVSLTVEDAAQNYKVYRLNDEGTLTDMNAVLDGDRLTFEAVNTGRYIVQVRGDDGIAAVIADIVGAPQFGFILLLCLLGIAVLVIVLLLIKLKKSSRPRGTAAQASISVFPAEEADFTVQNKKE